MKMVFDVDQVYYVGSKLLGTLKVLLPPNEPVRVQDLKVELKGEVFCRLKQQAAYYGEPLNSEPFYIDSVQLLSNQSLSNSKTFPINFSLENEKLFESFDGSYIHIKWQLEASFDPLSFFGARQVKRQRIIVRSKKHDETRSQSVILPIKTKFINLFAKFENIQCSIADPLVGQFMVESTKEELKRKKNTKICIGK